MEKLSSVLNETESDFLDSVLSQDIQICADALECRIDMKQVKVKLIKSQKTANSVGELKRNQLLTSLLICKVSYWVR